MRAHVLQNSGVREIANTLGLEMKCAVVQLFSLELCARGVEKSEDAFVLVLQ